MVDKMSKRTERTDKVNTPSRKNVKLDKVEPKNTKDNANSRKKK
jgi:hypothetical protein